MYDALVAHAAVDHTEGLGTLLASWERAPGLVGIALLVTVVYVRWLRAARLARGCSWMRLAAWVGAWVALVLALGSPVDALGGHLVSAHMVQHMLLGDLAPALLAVAISGPVLEQLARSVRRTPLARLARLVWTVPLPIVVGVWAATWGVWHTTWAYELALDVAPVHILEHGTLLVVGTWLWTVIVDPARVAADRVAARIGVAVGALFFGAVLTNNLTYVTEPSYPRLLGESERLMGWSSTVDQQLAGIVMLVGQGITIGVALVLLVRRHLATTGSAAPADEQAEQLDGLGAAWPRHPVGW